MYRLTGCLRSRVGLFGLINLDRAAAGRTNALMLCMLHVVMCTVLVVLRVVRMLSLVGILLTQGLDLW